MKYNPKNKSLSVSTDQLDSIYFNALHALKNIRIENDLPLKGYKRGHRPLEYYDHAMISIMQMCFDAGIDMGVESTHDYSKLDLSEEV